MDKIQFEMLTIYYGMLAEGCSKEAAFGYIAVMGYEPKNIMWLAEHLRNKNA